MPSTSSILGFEANVREVRNNFERIGYKVNCKKSLDIILTKEKHIDSQAL